MNHNFNRREFVKQTALWAGTAASASLVPRNVLGGAGNVAPSEKLNIAGIGVVDCILNGGVPIGVIVKDDRILIADTGIGQYGYATR